MRKTIVIVLALLTVAGAATRVSAEEPLIQRPILQPPSFGDSVIDRLLSNVVAKSELAQVQEKPLKELAARVLEENRAAEKTEQTGPLSARRERLIGEISALLYPDQAEMFRKTCEDLRDPAEVLPPRWAQERKWTLLGNGAALQPEEHARILAALTEVYRGIYPAQAALEAQYRDRLPDPKAAAEYRAKLEAILRPARAKTFEIVRGSLNPEQQKAFDAEWNRRQERRIQVMERRIRNENVTQTAEGRKALDEILRAFRAAARSLDLDSPEYGALTEKLQDDAKGVK